MKWINSHKLITAIISIPLLALAFFLFSFGEPCACYTPQQELAMYLNLPPYKQLNLHPYNQEVTLTDVETGFAKKFPKGHRISDNELLHFEEGNSSIEKSKDLWLCTYWLEESMIAQKGYRITIKIDEAGHVIETKAVRLESWFGIEFSS
jgi:hypothetical protein